MNDVCCIQFQSSVVYDDSGTLASFQEQREGQRCKNDMSLFSLLCWRIVKQNGIYPVDQSQRKTTVRP